MCVVTQSEVVVLIRKTPAKFKSRQENIDHQYVNKKDMKFFEFLEILYQRIDQSHQFKLSCLPSCWNTLHFLLICIFTICAN